MRLIDADGIHYTRLLSRQGLDMELVAKVAIDDMPTVDAEPVRHGRWIDDRTEMVCSECKAVYSDEIIFMNKDFECNDPPYCPNCGAKMDAEVSE